VTPEGDSGLSRLGRYELITPIGQGGMAEVRLALQRGPAGFEKLVVIKLVHEHLASQKTFVDMLLDEARVAALVKHPNVVDIYDLGEADGRYYIAMEYLEGEPLLGILRAGREGKRLDPLSMARLVADTAEGLDAAHELRSMSGEPMELVHHDVSLGNIVVLYNGQVKLVDFGVAKATATATAGAVKMHGKFGYVAPEKLRGAPGDRRSDIWSLGVVLWEALTFRRLFKAGSEKDTARLVLEHEIPRPSSINNDVIPDLDPIVMRALDRDLARRYPRAKDLAQDLEEVLRLHGYGGRNDRIAKYMQTTFADHIEARRKLLQEVSTKGQASAAVLQAAFAPPPRRRNPQASGEFTVRFKSPSEPPPSGPFPTIASAVREQVVEQVSEPELEVIEQAIERRRSEERMAEGTPAVAPRRARPPTPMLRVRKSASRSIQEPVAIRVDEPRRPSVVLLAALVVAGGLLALWLMTR
jgi:eukaryotic-like serine/threonine-protein kinase